jgi:DNA-binding CsgD family transcriptional regulator
VHAVGRPPKTSGRSPEPDFEQPRAAVALVSLPLGGRRAFIIDVADEALRMPDGLTAAECDIVTLLLQGLSTGDIARLRERSYRTVANQLAAIYRKAGVASRAELVARLALNAPEEEDPGR